MKSKVTNLLKPERAWKSQRGMNERDRIAPKSCLGASPFSTSIRSLSSPLPFPLVPSAGRHSCCRSGGHRGQRPRRPSLPPACLSVWFPGVRAPGGVWRQDAHTSTLRSFPPHHSSADIGANLFCQAHSCFCRYWFYRLRTFFASQSLIPRNLVK